MANNTLIFLKDIPLTPTTLDIVIQIPDPNKHFRGSFNKFRVQIAEALKLLSLPDPYSYEITPIDKDCFSIKLLPKHLGMEIVIGKYWVHYKVITGDLEYADPGTAIELLFQKIVKIRGNLERVQNSLTISPRKSPPA